MLETKNLCKTYKPKKGVPVLAVDHVSLRFPEKGMVFLLGKSGSGKSTMLNLLGGLDSYDEGEIIIKGISSKDFNQQRFDSYRNTYVGFIFQEYNVLEEFTVGANIALALELQSRTATDEEINAILKAVDLEGYGSRKPNELSGGQKQRVAIARALVKNPEIIMADEPTGALDSNTGRQVLDTLKKLSAEKLVIIVSHDREYAEAYADRIIELADGKVIRDVEAVHDADDAEKQLVFRSTSIEIPADYHLTEEDRIQINEYLDKLRSGASLMLPSASQRFAETDESKIPQQDGSKFSLIKSKLPMKSAFKIGCSSLKHKRFRLVMTILLSVAAFTLFALVDTFSSYDHIRACTDSLIDSDVNYISVNRELRHGSGLDEYWSSYGLRFSEAQMKELAEKSGVKVTGIFIPRDANLSFSGQYNSKKLSGERSAYRINMTHFCGYAEVTDELIQNSGYKLIAGKLPDGAKNEIAISKALCETFIKGGYHKPLTDEDMLALGDDDEYGGKSDANGTEPESKIKYDTIRTEQDMVGKVIRLMDTDYTVTGVIDTQLDLTRYDRLNEDEEKLDTAGQLINYMLYSELRTATNYSLSGCAMVGKGKVDEMVREEPKVSDVKNNADFSVHTDWSSDRTNNSSIYCYGQLVTTLDKIPESEIIWVGEKKDKLEKNQIILPLGNTSPDTDDMESMQAYQTLIEKGKDASAEEINAFLNKFGPFTLEIGYEESNYAGGMVSTWKSEDYEAEIVGFTNPSGRYSSAFVIPEDYVEKLVIETDGVYDSAVGPMPASRTDIEKFVRICYPEGDDVTERYELNNAVTYELDTVNSAVKVLAKVFLYIGIGFAVFAALLMANFITTSIHYKRQEIGILRAIGSRSNDVFRIFFSESFVIAMINFVLSAALCFTAVSVINWVLRKYVGILITVLHFGIRQVLLLLVISIGIAAIASFLPVRKIASKKPIDAIRDK